MYPLDALGQGLFFLGYEVRQKHIEEDCGG